MDPILVDLASADAEDCTVHYPVMHDQAIPQECVHQNAFTMTSCLLTDNPCAHGCYDLAALDVHHDGICSTHVPTDVLEQRPDAQTDDHSDIEDMYEFPAGYEYGGMDSVNKITGDPDTSTDGVGSFTYDAPDSGDGAPAAESTLPDDFNMDDDTDPDTFFDLRHPWPSSRSKTAPEMQLGEERRVLAAVTQLTRMRFGFELGLVPD